MKKLLLVPTVLAAMGTAKAQLALQNFNAAGFPAGWVNLNADGKTISSALNATIVAKLSVDGWMKWPRATSDSMMISTSLFTPPGTADRWLITPSFTVPSATTAISFVDALAYSAAGKSETLEIWVSPTAGATKADFTTKLATITPGGSYTTDRVSLAAYNGQTIRIGFREAGTDAGVLALDDVQTVTASSAPDMALTSVSPTAGDAASFNTVGGNITISGVAKNMDIIPVSSFTVKYRVGTGSVVSQTVTPTAPFIGAYAFSFTTPAVAPATQTDVKVWVEFTGDTKATNDTLTTKIGGYTTKPTKKIFMEEATGTWCGWCPRGLVYMDSIYHKYPNGVVVAAVHNADPMTVSAYDSYISSLVSGYPNMVVDRMYANDPSTAFSYYSMLSGNYGLAKIEIVPTLTGSNLSVQAKVTPTASTTSEYRLMMVLTEDRVSGTTTAYNQRNYYSGYATMKNSEFDFYTLPDPVPASKMKYDFVARGVYPGVGGASGSLPTNMTAGTTYTYTFPTLTLDPSWNANNVKAIVVLLNASTGTATTVLNAESKLIKTNSINELTSGVSGVNIYPNPAKDMVTADFELAQKATVRISVIDMMGKVVKTLPAQELNAGSYQVPTSVSELASGVYTMKIATDNGELTQRFSVIK